MDDPSRLLDYAGVGRALPGLICAAKAACVLAGSGLVVLAMKRRSAATRHLVWSLGLAGALAVLPLALVLPRWGFPIFSAPETVAPTRSEPGPRIGQADRPVPGEVASIAELKPILVPDLTQGSRPGPVSTPTTRPWGKGQWLLAIWCAGTALVLAWYAIGWSTIWRLGRRAGRIIDEPWLEAVGEAAGRLGVSGRVTLLRGGPMAMPITWGILRPRVLLPEEADSWPSDRRRTVLLHELAHVRRRDGLTQWLGLAACAAYWFNPMAWWAASRLMTEREQACDDMVIEAGERPSDYATQLLVVARSLRPSTSLSHAAMAMARPSGLERRLVAILDAHRSRRGPARRLVALGLILVLAASATLAAMSPMVRPGSPKAVSGRVVGVDGEAVEGVSVVLLASRFSNRGPRKDSPPSRVLGRSRTDAQGAFRIELAGPEIRTDDHPIVVATSPGSSFAARWLLDPNGPIGEPIRLRPEQPVEVKLVDLQGAPLIGAEVHLINAYPQTGGDGLEPGLLTREALPDLAAGATSDAQGRFELRGIGPDHSIALEIRAAGFGKQRLLVQTRAETRTTTLAIGRALIIEGRVTLGKDGPPAIGAPIKARSMSMKEGIGQNRGDVETSTDLDGRYRFEASPGGSVRIEAYPPSQGADAFLLRATLMVPTDSVASRVDFVLPKGILVRGRVTEAGTGQPVAGAVVSHQAHERNNPYYIQGLASYLNGDEQNATTGLDGSYHLAVMPGPGYLLVKGPTWNYLHEEISSVDLRGELIWPNNRQYPDAFRRLEPKPGEGPLDVNLTLRPGTKVGGHLVGPGGEPARDVVFFSRWIVSPWDWSLNQGQSTEPARDGRFELGGAHPDSSAPVFFLDAGRQLGAVVEISGKQAGQDLEVKLQPCGSASVKFVDGEGKPFRAGRAPAHLEIVLTPGASFGDLGQAMRDGNRSPLLADSFHATNLDRDRYQEIKVDPEGRMRFPTLIPGATYRIVVFNQPVKTEIEFTVEPGEAKDLGELKIPNVEGVR